MNLPPVIPDFVRAFPEIDLPFEGLRGWLLQADGQQVVFLEASADVVVPEHSHDQQWEIPVAGKVELRIDGGTRIYQPGDTFYVPAGKPHGAFVHAGYAAVMIFNEPGRYQVSNP